MEEKKEGKGTCYKRVSKNGNPYYNGKFELDGKLYWLKLFSTKTMDGQQAISFIIDKRQRNCYNKLVEVCYANK